MYTVCENCWLLPIGFIVLLLLFSDRFRALFTNTKYNKPTRIDGKVVIITGCNTGIGKETALDLAERGGKIYMACRNYEKCEKARLEIIQKTGNKNIFNRKLDLSSFESIRQFSEDFIREENRLDILINNAGYAGPKQLTKDNFEMGFGVNHLGHFLLTNLLLDTLKKSAPSRIVVLGSLAYLLGKINKNDLNSEKTSYSSYFNYCNSKLANLLFTLHLSKLKGTGVTVNSVHPGIIKTTIYENVHTAFLFFANIFMGIFMKDCKSGAQTTITVAIDPELEKISGKFFNNCKIDKLLSKARDEETAEWLWNASEKLTTKISN